MRLFIRTKAKTVYVYDNYFNLFFLKINFKNRLEIILKQQDFFFIVLEIIYIYISKKKKNKNKNPLKLKLKYCI